MLQLLTILLSLTSIITVSYGALVSEMCLDCLCLLISRCDIHRGCADGDCGPFGITMPFWMDSGRPKHPDGFEVEASRLRAEYERCTTNLVCATRSIQRYAALYTRDCNNDGVFDCLDYAAIHYRGPSGCLTEPFPAKFRRFMERCLTKNSTGVYSVTMHELIEKEDDKNKGKDSKKIQ